MGYCPYIAVEAVSVVPSKYSMTYSFGSESATGILPASAEVTDGDTYTLPKNFTLYKEGYTLTGWNDGTNTYTPGQVITPTGNMTFTPVFTSNNGVTLADANSDVILKWDFQRGNGCPTISSEGGSAFLVTQASVNGNNIDVKLDINTNPGKFANANWTDWAQVNEGTTFSFPARADAIVTAFSMNEPKNDSDVKSSLDGNDYNSYSSYVATYSASPATGVSTLTVKGGSYYRYIQLTYPGTPAPLEPYTNTWYFGKSNGAPVFALESTADYTYIVNGHDITISTNTTSPRGKLNNNARNDEWAQCNNNTIFKIPAFVGAKLSWRSNNTGSAVGFTIGGTLYNNYYIATAEETVNMSAVGLGYISYIQIEPVTMYAMTGTVSNTDVNGNTIVFTANGNGQTYTATIAEGAFSINLPADSYTAQLGNTTSYIITAPASVTVSAAGSMGEMTITSSIPQTVTGDIANAPAEAFTLTFTGTGENVVNLDCLANATSFTTSLRPDTYTMSSSVGTLSTLSQESFTVVSSAVNHNIYFPGTIPAATQTEITVDNTAAVSANVYHTVTDALAAAKAGSISSPVITLTSGQTYREQVIVDMPNVTLKTSGEGKATITFYYGIGYSYYSLNNSGYYDKDRAMTRNSILNVGPARWGATVLVRNSGSGFKAENIIFENSFNQYYIDDEVIDGVVPNSVGSSITYDRTLRSGAAGYMAADSKAVTERAAAIGFENNPTGIQLYNCEFRGSQDTFYTSGKIHVKNCNIIGNTDYIFGGGDVVFDNCDLTIGGYSDQEASAYITANNTTVGQYYIFRDCTVKASNRTYVKANLGRDWGGTNAGVYFFNLQNEIGSKLDYKWSNMGGAVSAGTANLHIYDFDPTVNANYSTTGSTGANVNGLVSDEDATTLYTGVITRLGFTPAHIYDIALDQDSYYNPIKIKAANGGTGNVTLTRGITANNWSTIVLPFAMDATQVTTAFGSGVKVAELTSGDATTLNFTTVTEMEANKPYAIKVASDFTTATISNVTFVDATPSQNVETNWQFIGTYTSGNIPADSYFFSGNKLWQAEDAKNTIKPFRAYFTSTAGAHEVNFVIDSEGTGISSLTTDFSPNGDGNVYTLNGVRLNKTPTEKGLYIVNGKKVIIK